MKADYDSEADALSIDLVEVDGWDGGEDVDGLYCHVAFVHDRPVNVELLTPRDHLDLLGVAAERYGLDGPALLAAAQAALAAPDRVVTIGSGREEPELESGTGSAGQGRRRCRGRRSGGAILILDLGPGASLPPTLRAQARRPHFLCQLADSANRPDEPCRGSARKLVAQADHAADVSPELGSV